MWHGTRVCLIVEAKSLGTEFTGNELEQAINYCIRTECLHFVLTNGDLWHGYSIRQGGNLGAQRQLDFSLTEGAGIMELFWLWPGNFEGTTARPKFPPTA